jgi:starch-binding outer membrane protein, SusD/RagB family
MLTLKSGARITRPAKLLRAALVGTLAFGVTACSVLDVTDPTIIQSSSLDNSSGAHDLWSGARNGLFSSAIVTSFYEGLLADEFFVDASPGSTVLESYLNRRESMLVQGYSGGYSITFLYWQALRANSDVAMPRVRAYAPAGAREALLGDLFAFRGFAATRLAESTCPGFPLREVSDYQPVYGPPLTTEQAFTQAVAEFDSALAYAKDSARVLDFARVGKARALLGLGRFTEAAAVASEVTPGYELSGRDPSDNYSFWFADWQPAGIGVGDQEGINGIDFVSAADPRVELQEVRKANYGDTSTVLYRSTKYIAEFPYIIVASDIEAQLIRAEAALNAHDATWLTILNDLRRDRVTPSLPELDDPVNFDDQVDLLFRERAFWLFATGHRLGDLRRLIHVYGRTPESVFPTGPYRVAGQYGAATSIPFDPTLETMENPAVTGCTEQ